jgi:hypothetical protein
MNRARTFRRLRVPDLPSWGLGLLELDLELGLELGLGLGLRVGLELEQGVIAKLH